MGVISFTFRPHYPGWVLEIVDDVDRAKLILSSLEWNLCNLVAVLTEWSQNCLFFYRLLQVLSVFRIKDHNVRKTSVYYACTTLTVTKLRKSGCALEMRSGENPSDVTTGQGTGDTVRFAVFIPLTSFLLFLLFISLSLWFCWLVEVIREVGQIMT